MNVKKEKRIIVLLLFCLIVKVIFTSCNTADDSTTVHQNATNLTDKSQVKHQRTVPFEVKDEIIDALSLDSVSISVLDDLYSSAASSYQTLSARKIVDQIDKSYSVYSDKYNELWQQYYDKTGEPTDLYVEYAIGCSTGALISILIYDEAIGDVSAEKAAYEIISHVDEICSFYYIDYIPILNNDIVEVNSIIEMYESNEISAEAEYGNKLINITGIITEISRDLFDKTYIALANNSNKYADEIRCYFSDDFNEEILKLKKGDKVTIAAHITEKDTLYVNAELWNIISDNN